MNLKRLSPICASVALAMSASLAFAESGTASNRSIFCQSVNGVPTTMASVQGKDRPIFHWRSEALPQSFNPQQLCDSVSNKLANYADQGSQAPSFIGFDQGGLPAVCATANPEDCSVVLFTLAPAEDPITVSNKVLEGILDSELKQGKQEIVSNTRGVQSFVYPVNFWQLMGLKFIK